MMGVLGVLATPMVGMGVPRGQRLGLGRFVEIGVQFEPCVFHTFEGQYAVRYRLEMIRVALHHDHFQTMVVVEVNVQRRTNAVAQLVLKICQPLHEIPDVMVINQSQGGHGFSSAPRLCLDDSGPRQVAQRFRTGTAPAFHQFVEFSKQSCFHRHAESYEFAIRHIGTIPEAPCKPKPHVR